MNEGTEEALKAYRAACIAHKMGKVELPAVWTARSRLRDLDPELLEE